MLQSQVRTLQFCWKGLYVATEAQDTLPNIFNFKLRV